MKVLDEAVRMLKARKAEVEAAISKLRKSSENCAVPVAFDLGVNAAFLEIDQTEEVKNFYKLSNPSPQTLLIGKVIMGLLGKWDLILSGNSSTVWKNIQSYFQSQMGEEICTFGERV